MITIAADYISILSFSFAIRFSSSLYSKAYYLIMFLLSSSDSSHTFFLYQGGIDLIQTWQRILGKQIRSHSPIESHEKLMGFLFFTSLFQLGCEVTSAITTRACRYLFMVRQLLPQLLKLAVISNNSHSFLFAFSQLCFKLLYAWPICYRETFLDIYPQVLRNLHMRYC